MLLIQAQTNPAAPVFPSAFTARSGTVYNPNSQGVISVPNGPDLIDALQSGFEPIQVTLAQYSTNSATSGATATVTSVASANENVLNMTGTLTGGAALTLPTAALVLAGLPGGGFVGQTFKLRVINSSSGAYTWTVTTAAGWTLTGTMTVAQNTWRDFIATVTNVGTPAITLQQVGTGTNS